MFVALHSTLTSWFGYIGLDLLFADKNVNFNDFGRHHGEYLNFSRPSSL